MREAGIKRFLEALGVDRIKMSTERENWVNCPCPLAPYLHAGGSDARPSFGISINNEGPSIYWCFGCGNKAKRLDWLLHTFFVAERRYPFDAADVFLREEITHIEEEDDGVPKAPNIWTKPTKGPVKPLPPVVLKKYPLLQNAREDYEVRRLRAWLSIDRGIPDWVQNRYRLRFSRKNQTVIFPLTDSNGRIFLMRERMRKEKRMWTVNPELAGVPKMEFPKLREVGVWFGMELIDWLRPVLIVEGEIDAMRLSALGFLNALASATSQVTDAQIDALTARTVIIGYDADKAGKFARNRIVDRLGRKSTILDADWSQAKKEDGTPCKDAGDLPNREALRKVLNNLETV